MADEPYQAPLAPETLHLTGKRAWSTLCDNFELEDADDLSLLLAHCEALDRVAQARRLIRNDGLVITDDKGAPHAHPAVAIERQSRQQAAQILGQLQRSVERVAKFELQIEREKRIRAKEAAAASKPPNRNTGRRGNR